MKALKVLSVILVLASFGGLLAGCSQGDEETVLPEGCPVTRETSRWTSAAGNLALSHGRRRC
jgi:hypothetical protein